MFKGLRRAIVVVGVAALVAYAALLLLKPFPLVVTGRMSQLVVIGSAMAAGAMASRAARWSAGRVRVGMTVLGVASLAWALAEALWLAAGWRSGGVGVPFPPAAVAAFAVTMISVPTATVLLVQRAAASLRTLLDGLLIGTSLLYVMWALVIAPEHRAGQSGFGTLLYPLADVLIVSMVLLLLGGSHPRVRGSLELVAVGMVVMFAADAGYSYLVIVGGYRFGALPDLGWTTAYLLIALGLPRRDTLRGLTTLAEHQRPRPYLPYLPFALAIGTGITMFAAHRVIEPAVYALSLVLTVLVVARQLITVRDNHALTSQLTAAVDDLRFRADHDPLTGLANRSLFHESVERALGGTTRARVAILYVDLDAFKPVNDAHGHDAGDRVLILTAERLRATAGGGAIVARLGGDEFAILVTDAVVADLTRLADDMLTAIRAPVELPCATVRVGASIGIADGVAGRIGLGELLRDADAAMYAAKRGGRNRFVVSGSSLTRAGFAT